MQSLDFEGFVKVSPWLAVKHACDFGIAGASAAAECVWNTKTLWFWNIFSLMACSPHLSVNNARLLIHRRLYNDRLWCLPRFEVFPSFWRLQVSEGSRVYVSLLSQAIPRQRLFKTRPVSVRIRASQVLGLGFHSFAQTLLWPHYSMRIN